MPQIVELESPRGGEEAIAAAARLLSEAKFPVVLNGAGVVLSGAIPAAAALAERLAAPVCCNYQHNDAFPGSHPLSCGPLGYNGSKAAMELVAKADVVLALGTRLNPFSSLPAYGIDYWPKEAKIIQVDINADRIGLTKKVTVGIQGDARMVAEQILAQLPSTAGAGGQERLTMIEQARSRWAKELATMDHQEDDPGTTWNERARKREPNRMSARQAWRAIMAVLPKGRSSRATSATIAPSATPTRRSRPAGNIWRRVSSAPVATASPRSSAPRSDAPTCLWWALPATAPSASR